MRKILLLFEQSNCKCSSHPSSTASHQSKACVSHQPTLTAEPKTAPVEELAPPGTASGEAETAAEAGTAAAAAAAAQAVGPAEGPGTAAGSTWAEQGQSGSTALGEAASSSTAVEVAAAAVPWGAVPLEGAEPYHQPAASSFRNGKDQRSRNQATKPGAGVYTSIEEERNRDKP